MDEFHYKNITFNQKIAYKKCNLENDKVFNLKFIISNGISKNLYCDWDFNFNLDLDFDWFFLIFFGGMELDGSTSRSEEEEEYSKDGIFLSDMNCEKLKSHGRWWLTLWPNEDTLKCIGK